MTAEVAPELYSTIMRPPKARLERLVVASDGQSTSDAALHFAKLLAERDLAQVQVVAVFSPRLAVPPHASTLPNRRRDHRNRIKIRELQGRVERQLRDRIGVTWPLELRRGYAPWIIAEVARAAKADLILLGHSATTENGLRRPGRHTAEQLACACEIPVLAVSGDGRSLPRLAVAVVDRGGASARAQRGAASLIADGATLIRVSDRSPRAVLKVAKSLGADLLSVPLAGDSFEVRALMSGCVVELLDHAYCSVLVTPSRGASDAAAEAAGPEKDERYREPERGAPPVVAGERVE